MKLKKYLDVLLKQYALRLPFHIPGKGRAVRLLLDEAYFKGGLNGAHHFIKKLKNKHLADKGVRYQISRFCRRMRNYSIGKYVLDKIRSCENLDEFQVYETALWFGLSDNLKLKNNYDNRIGKPDFLIIGCMRSGTTWLRKILNQHPNIRFPIQGGLEYFATAPEPNIEQNPEHDADINRNWSFNNYLSNFVKNSPCEIVGEKTETYIYNVDEIVKKLPECKLICVVRNPLERIVSQYYHTLSAKRNLGPTVWYDYVDEKNLKFEDFVLKNMSFCRDHGLYHKHLKNNYLNVKILLYDDLKNNPVNVLSEACEFLDIIPNKHMLKECKTVINSNKGSGDYYQKISNAGVLNYLQNFYKEDIQNVSQNINRNLEHWLKEPKL